jgi:hypothetical protein
MDHRCLYGHRVLSSFTFAIQNRSCPTCGAATVSVHGYAAARKLSLEGGLDALAAFNAMRLLETDWKLVPAENAPAEAPAPARPAALAAAVEEEGTAPAAVPVPEEVEIVEETETAAPPPRPAAASAAAVKPVVRSRPPRGERENAASFDASEAEFFKS